MPCNTVVQVQVEKTKWTEQARKKMGLSLTAAVSPQLAAAIRVEAGKLKTIAAVKVINPNALITGTTLGSKKLTIRIS